MAVKRVSIDLEESLHIKIKTLAVQNKETVSEAYTRIINEYFEKNNENKD